MSCLTPPANLPRDEYKSTPSGFAIGHRDIETPHIKRIALLSYEESTRLAKNKSPLLKDCTADLLGHNQAYREQLLRSTDHWRSRIPVNSWA